MNRKLKVLGAALFYVVATYIIIFLMNNYSWINQQLQCKVFVSKPPVFSPPPFEYKNTGLVTIWFDDGWLSQYKSAFPLMQAHGFPGVASIITGTVCKKNYMNWNQIYNLERNGWQIVSHSSKHICDPYYLQHHPKVLDEEVQGSKKVLEEHGIHTNIFVTPCGYPSYLYPAIEQKILENYSYIRISDSYYNFLPLGNSPLLRAYFIDDSTPVSQVAQLIDSSKQDHFWLILVFHHFDNRSIGLNTSDKKFKDILDLIQSSELPVVLPAQVLGNQTISDANS